jgi:hypothetical protein
MVDVCSMHVSSEKYIQNFSPKTWREEFTFDRFKGNIKMELKYCLRI